VAALQGYQEHKLGIVLKLALGAVGALLIVQAALGAPTAAGVWRQVDETGKAGALVTITEDGGAFVGRLSHLFLDPGDDPNPICNQCPGDKRNQPVLGLVFIEGMKQSGLDYDSGTILDPETGKVYSANMHLSADGALLTVRGYLGLSIFGRSQTWVRVESDDGASAPVDRAPR
jgi:uncharacterized protein (DUF2147 family)